MPPSAAVGARYWGRMPVSTHCLLCRVGSSWCAIPIEHVVEVMRPLPIVAVANAPVGVLGLCTMRGAATVVVDVARCVLDEATSCTRFVAVRVADRRLALAVDAVAGSLEIARERLVEVPALLSGAAAVGAIATLDTELLLLLRTTKLLPDFEVAELTQHDRAC